LCDEYEVQDSLKRSCEEQSCEAREIVCVETRIETVEVTREAPVYLDSHIEQTTVTKEIPIYETRIDEIATRAGGADGTDGAGGADGRIEIPFTETRKFKPDVNLIAQSYKAATIKSILGGHDDYQTYNKAERAILKDLLSDVRVKLDICTPRESYALDIGAGVGRLSTLLAEHFNFVHLVEKN